MEIRNVRSREIEFEVDPEHPPALGDEVTLTISMGGATIKRAYRVTELRMWGPPDGTQTVRVVAKGDGADA